MRAWWWGGDPDNGDHSLYDKEGLTIARIVLEGGRYRLRTPVTTPTPSWTDLDEAKHGAASVALSAMSLDPKLTARIKRDNEAQHPMGPPLNLAPNGNHAVSSFKINFRSEGPWSDDLDIPAFLRR